MEKCQFEGCPRNMGYALYRLLHNGTKTWGHFCSEHEEQVVKTNTELRRKYPDRQWHDPTV